MLQIYHRRLAVQKFTGLSRSVIYDLMSRDEFPKPIKIGKRSVAWRESDLAEWQAQREGGIAKSETKAKAI